MENTQEKRLRIIDLNELEAMAKMKDDALKSYLINSLIPALEFPDAKMSEHFTKEEEKQPIKEEEKRYFDETSLLEIGFKKQYADRKDGFYTLIVNDKFYLTVDFKTITLSIHLQNYGHIQKLEHIKTIEQITNLCSALNEKEAYDNQEEKQTLEERVREKRETFEKAVEPVMKWLSENSNPHAKIIIENNSAELLEGAMIFKSLNK